MHFNRKNFSVSQNVSTFAVSKLKQHHSCLRAAPTPRAEAPKFSMKKNIEILANALSQKTSLKFIAREIDWQLAVSINPKDIDEDFYDIEKFYHDEVMRMNNLSSVPQRCTESIWSDEYTSGHMINGWSDYRLPNYYSLVTAIREKVLNAKSELEKLGCKVNIRFRPTAWFKPTGSEQSYFGPIIDFEVHTKEFDKYHNEKVNEYYAQMPNYSYDERDREMGYAEHTFLH